MTHSIPRLLLISTATPIDQPAKEAIWAALSAGIRHLLLRQPGLSADDLRPLAQRWRQRTHEQGALLLIHQHIDVALAVAADGLHLPEKGLDTAMARHRLGPNRLLGRSCHDPVTAQQALNQGADYVTLSPLFTTQSHSDATPIGVEKFRSWRTMIHGPVLALGGIDQTNITAALAAGADGVAMIRAILAQSDPYAAARCCLAQMDVTLKGDD
ncbi:MAG: thiamine phosphate synthase [Magnetococcales bacterium]|nr:thiamine phosphate synthase [Magnetococcales bacterium]